MCLKQAKLFELREMKQSKACSAVESTVQMTVGFMVSLFVWTVIVTPWLGIPSPLTQALEITAIFTATSWVRSYLIRRWFNSRKAIKSYTPITINKSSGVPLCESCYLGLPGCVCKRFTPKCKDAYNCGTDGIYCSACNRKEKK